MRSEAQTLKGCDRKRATQADLHFAMAKQYMLPLLRRLTNLRTAKWPPVGRAATTVSGPRGALSEEDGNREAGTVAWAGEKNVCYACPALRLLGTPSLPTRLLGPSAITTHDLRHDSLTKNFGVWGAHAANEIGENRKNRVKAILPGHYGHVSGRSGLAWLRCWAGGTAGLLCQAGGAAVRSSC